MMCRHLGEAITCKCQVSWTAVWAGPREEQWEPKGRRGRKGRRREWRQQT